jgi:molecular chaperone GrpE (heat shock protein)
LLVQALLEQIDSAEAADPSILQGPLLLTPAMLKLLAKQIQSSAKKNSTKTKDNIIAKLQSQLKALKTKATACKAEIDQIKKACLAEVEEVRRQSQLAMQAYMKATVNAFDRLQQPKD